MTEGRVQRFLKVLKGKEEEFEANRRKRELEWCRCGMRRMYFMHYRVFAPKWTFGEIPPHKFQREGDMMQVVQYEEKERRALEEYR
jgi:hypothetical protein